MIDDTHSEGIMNQFSVSCAPHRVSKLAALAQYGRILGGKGPERENRKSKIHNLLKYFDLPAIHTTILSSFLNQFNLQFFKNNLLI